MPTVLARTIGVVLSQSARVILSSLLDAKTSIWHQSLTTHCRIATNRTYDWADFIYKWTTVLLAMP